MNQKTTGEEKKFSLFIVQSKTWLTYIRKLGDSNDQAPHKILTSASAGHLVVREKKYYRYKHS